MRKKSTTTHTNHQIKAYRPSGCNEVLKRILDAFGASVGLIVFSPLLAICGLWIKLVDGGPIFYAQWRVGRNGWLFRIYKLRTMAINAETPGGAQWAQVDDTRIIKGGNWMRHSHIDELPQLWNIFIGNMSLVGPRPERPELLEQLRQNLPGIERRLVAKPGLTGLAQIKNGYTNDLAGARKKLAYDLKYLRQRSFLGDLQLVFQTMPRFWDHAAL